MKRLKYQTKFLLYHAGIMLLIILGLVGYFYHIVVKEMKEKEEQDFRIITEKTVTQMEGLYYNMDRAALQIAANPEIVKVFQSISGEPEENYFTKHPVQKAEVKKLLESYNFKNDGHSRICLYNKNYDFVCTSNQAVTEEGIQQFFMGNTFQDLQEFFQGENKYVFYQKPKEDILSLGMSSQVKYLAVVREIKDYYSNSNRCGYVEVQEPVDKLDAILGDSEQEIQAELLDQEGNVVYHTPGKRMQKENGELYKAVVHMENAPYTVRFYQNPVEYQAAMKQFYVVLFGAVFVILLVAVCLEQLLANYLSRPLIALNHSLKTVTMNHLHVDIVDQDSGDIVIRLEDSFNSMLEKLNDSMNNQISAKTNEIKSYFFALQSQMNPHFLHNILAIISMEAQIDGNQRIPDICQKLGEILRYNSHMEDGYSTIEKECANAEAYMLLMKVRYENMFEYEIHIEAGAQQIKIPKLIVQPICENCFQHGFKNVEPIWKITVTAWCEGIKWYIRIKDNGSGFSEEVLEALQKQKENIGQSDIKYVLEHISIGGLCLPNIYTRMKIIYGETFVCELYNEQDGAAVLLGGETDDKSIGSGG